VKKYLVVFYFCLIPFSSWEQFPDVKPEQIITLVFRSNLYGEYEPCGWGGGKLGGLVRRASFLEKLRKDRKNLIVVDSGDLLYSPGYDLLTLPKRDQELTSLKADHFLQTYNLMGYDAFTPGEVDLSWGIAQLKKMNQQAKFAFLLANLQEVKTKKPVF
jgi:5'-nucleotidase